MVARNVFNSYTLYSVLKDGSFQINSFRIKQLFRLQKRLLKWRQRFVQSSLKKHFFFVLFCFVLFLFFLLLLFLQKSAKFRVLSIFRTIRLCSNFTSMWYKHFKGNVWRDFRLPMAIHTLFDQYLDHMLVKFEQIRMVRTIQNVGLFDKNGKPFLTKYWRHFERRFCDWNNCLMLSYINLKTIIFLVSSCLSSFVSLWIECGFLFEWYSFLYMQII